MTVVQVEAVGRAERLRMRNSICLGQAFNCLLVYLMKNFGRSEKFLSFYHNREFGKITSFQGECENQQQFFLF